MQSNYHPHKTCYTSAVVVKELCGSKCRLCVFFIFVFYFGKSVITIFLFGTLDLGVEKTVAKYEIHCVLF